MCAVGAYMLWPPAAMLVQLTQLVSETSTLRPWATPCTAPPAGVQPCAWVDGSRCTLQTGEAVLGYAVCALCATHLDKSGDGVKGAVTGLVQLGPEHTAGGTYCWNLT